MTTFKKAGKLLLAAIDQATREKWKKFKGQNLFKETATEMIEQLLEEAHGQVPAALAEPIKQASEAGGKLLMGAFEAAYETAVDDIGKWLEQTAGEDSKAILERVLLMDTIDRIAHSVAYKTILEAVDKETWAREKNQVWKQIASQVDRLAKDFFEKGLGKKAKKQVKNVSPEAWGDKLKEAVVQAALPVQKTNLPKVLEEFNRYAKQLSDMTAGEEGQEEQKAASVRFSSMDPVLFEKYLDVCATDHRRIALVVKPEHLADFVNSIISHKETSTEAWQVTAENIEHLIGPESPLYYSDVVDVMDGLDVGVATAEKLFEKYVAGKEVVSVDDFVPSCFAKLDKYLSKVGYDPTNFYGTIDIGQYEDFAKQFSDCIYSIANPIEEATGEVFPSDDATQEGLWGAVGEGRGETVYEWAMQNPENAVNELVGFSDSAAVGFGYIAWVVNALVSGDFSGIDVGSAAEAFEITDDEAEELIDSFRGRSTMANIKKKTAAAQKVAKLVEAGFAPPVLPGKNGENWVPDLTDPATRKAFFNYTKKFGFPKKEELDKILSVAGNKEVFKQLKAKQAGYPNTQEGALRFADERIKGFNQARRISAVPSADNKSVWLVLNHDAGQAFVANLKVGKVEVVDYTQSLKEVK